MKKVLYLLLLLFIGHSTFATKDVRIILRLNKAEQNDTLGYNLVEQLSQIIYYEIQSHRVKVWDSPKKQTEIQSATITDLENTSGIKFIDLDNIFLYENWTLDNKLVQVNPVGILFATKDKRGDDITFGYIDFNDVKELLATRYLSVNANGYINIDVATVLKSKRYTYSIVQYGRKLVGNYTLSEKFKNDAFNKRKLDNDDTNIPKQKIVRYEVTRSTQKRDPKIEKANFFLDTLSAYLTRNMDVFFNLGGDKLQSHVTAKGVNITKVEIEEQWALKDGKTQYKTSWLTLYVNDKPMQPMAMEDMMDWKLVIYYSNLERFLRDKLFAYSIVKINDQNIQTGKGEAYAEALRSGKWSQLNQVVK